MWGILKTSHPDSSGFEVTRKKILAPSVAEPVEAAFTPSPKTYNPLPFIFFVPLWSFILLLSPFGGTSFWCPPHRGGAGGGDSDCSGSNPYNNHLRHFVTPPPAEDTYKVCPSCGLRFVCRPLEANCVAILLCHYETPLRRRGNLMYSVIYEIASVTSLLRNDVTTQSLRRHDKCEYNYETINNDSSLLRNLG